MDEVDPFKHELQLTKWDWFRTYFLAVCLVPIRLVIFFMLVISMSVISRLALFIHCRTKSIEEPFTSYWVKSIQKFVQFLMRTGVRACGFSVTTKGERVSPPEAPIAILAPHSTLFDAWIAFGWYNAGSIIGAEEHFDIPILGSIFQFFQYIFVRRTDPDSRENVQKEMIRRTSAVNEGWSQILLTPEGTCSNRKVILPFKLGAFIPGQPIQPATIRYPNRLDTVTWTFNQSHGAISVLWLTLAQPITRVEFDFLPVYHPSPQEKEDPKLFAFNVRKLLAAHCNISTSDITYGEAKKRFAKSSRKKDE